MAGGFKSNINTSQLAKLIGPQLEELTRKFDKAVEELTKDHRGQPIDQIKPYVKARFQREGITLSGKELTEYSNAISNGTKIKFRVG